eukprot:2403676-Prymnesium_polylepis.1
METVFGADESTYGGRPFEPITSTGVVKPGKPLGNSLPPKYFEYVASEASPAPPAPPEASPAPPI